MKHLILLPLLILVFGASAQENWATFTHTIPVGEHHGKKFRAQAVVKINGADADASAQLAVKLNKSDNAPAYAQTDHTTSKEWKLVSIDGIISGITDSLSVIINVRYNGRFYIDDIQLDVEMRKGKWSAVYKANFEDGKTDFSQAPAWKNILFSSTIDQTQAKSGKSSLVINGKNVPNWGVNDAVGRFAEVNGVKLYYEVYGEGKPLIVLHGNGGSISNAAPFYPALMKKYKVIAIDSRGQGKSSDTNDPFSYEQMASDVSALLDQLHVDSAYVWGQSDGAILAFILALDHPKKIKRAVAFGGNIQPDSSAVHPWAVNFLDRLLIQSKDEKEKKLNQLMKNHPHIDYSQLRRIKAPFLIMSGDRDVIRLEHTVKIFHNIPNSNLCILPGSTHGGAWERQELFLKLMTDFFDKPFQKPDTRSWFE
jgi:pimeloyl-ACP methyl ester carboxylesterase